ncbi:hypothetical protein MHYP_G00293930 [Metynnis hypsauchen]
MKGLSNCNTLLEESSPNSYSDLKIPEDSGVIKTALSYQDTLPAKIERAENFEGYRYSSYNSNSYPERVTHPYRNWKSGAQVACAPTGRLMRLFITAINLGTPAWLSESLNQEKMYRMNRSRHPSNAAQRRPLMVAWLATGFSPLADL